MVCRRHRNEKSAGSKAVGKPALKDAKKHWNNCFYLLFLLNKQIENGCFSLCFIYVQGLLGKQIVNISFLFVLFYQMAIPKYSLFLRPVPDWDPNKRNRKRIK
jgi:hypothetical protein